MISVKKITTRLWVYVCVCVYIILNVLLQHVQYDLKAINTRLIESYYSYTNYDDFTYYYYRTRFERIITITVSIVFCTLLYNARRKTRARVFMGS